MSLKFRLMTIISLVLMLIFTIITIYNIRQGMMIAEKSEQALNEMLDRAVRSELIKRQNAALTAVLVVGFDEEVQALFAARDRQGLEKIMMPVFDRLRDHISQFHFHLPDGTSFLRLHDPGQYGDPLHHYRLAVRMAAERKEIVTGLGKGLGGLGYRAVMPVYHGGVFWGTVEMGGDLGVAFLEELGEIYSADFYLYDADNGLILTAATAEEKRHIISEAEADLLSGGHTLFLHSDDLQHGIIIIPLQDLEGNVLALLQVVSDRGPVMAKIAALKQNLVIFSLGAVLITAFLIMLLMQSLVLKPLYIIKQFLQKVSNLELNTRVEVPRNDEIGEMAVNLNHMVDVIRNAMGELEAAHDQTIQILDSMKAVVYVSDFSTYEILFINKHGRDIYGDVAGKTCWQVLQKDREKPCAFCSQDTDQRVMLEEGRLFTWELESTLNRRHYEYRGSAVKWFDGRIVRLVIATDTTERKLAEDIILQSREWYRTLAEDIPLFVCRFSPLWVLTYVNDAYCRFFG